MGAGSSGSVERMSGPSAETLRRRWREYQQALSMRESAGDRRELARWSAEADSAAAAWFEACEAYAVAIGLKAWLQN